MREAPSQFSFSLLTLFLHSSSTLSSTPRTRLDNSRRHRIFQIQTSLSPPPISRRSCPSLALLNYNKTLEPSSHCITVTLHVRYPYTRNYETKYGDTHFTITSAITGQVSRGVAIEPQHDVKSNQLTEALHDRPPACTPNLRALAQSPTFPISRLQ